VKWGDIENMMISKVEMWSTESMVIFIGEVWRSREHGYIKC
jgi:hypothetical protein